MQDGMRLTSATTLALALTLSTWGLLVFGASVRVHGAGLACPDWPLCFGQVVPEIDFQVGLEWGHRVIAGVISLGLLALGALVLPRGGGIPRGARALWGIGLAVLGVQVVLGGLTVLELLAEWTVTSHLLAGNTFCLLLLLLTLTLREAQRPAIRAPVSPLVRLLGVGFAGLVVVQLALGGWVASSYAGLACGTWPTCNGAALVPTLEGAVGLQVVHRLVAYALLGGAVAVVVATWPQPRLRRAALTVLGVVVFQATVGVANVLLQLPVEVTLLHSFGAAATVLSTGWWQFEAWRAPTTEPNPAVALEAV